MICMELRKQIGLKKSICVYFLVCQGMQQLDKPLERAYVDVNE